MRIRKWVFRNGNSMVEVEDGTLSVGNWGGSPEAGVAEWGFV